VKLQTYTPDTITMASEREEFRVSGGTLWEWAERFTTLCRSFQCRGSGTRTEKLAEGLGMDCFSSAFDSTAVDFWKR